ncbi:hypothetical protein MtrunA17_Chr8g0335181 [Medicago truncatula]|uniref:Uncharacterized protein n=1 Tax=Medicago truncatula TaxID=3880 RepID=A0A072TWE3_MEDTR|nr:hypothetical protein MTR_8g006735 [Medicago truncatula]RHN38621.1 hypothetical protein MtrunA17_Chr8g0335181 [Medicago truncatula]
MVPYVIGEILIYVSSKMSSKYGGKKMSHLGGCWWDYETLGLEKDVTLEKMKQGLRSEFEEKNVINVWEDLPPIEVYSNPGYRKRFLDQWSDDGFNYNSTLKGSNEADYEILKDIIFWRLKVKWTAERCTLCQIFMSWAMRVMIKRVQKSQFADLIKDMVSNNKVLKKFWVDVENLVETRASPDSYVALFSEDMINKRLLRYLGTLSYNIVLISRDRKNQLQNEANVRITWGGFKK